jgi:exonuclease-1
MCILTGCDYLDNIPGVGIKAAHKKMLEYRDAIVVIKHFIEDNRPVPVQYLAEFKNTEKIFKYHTVFDPKAEKVVHLTCVTKWAIVLI